MFGVTAQPAKPLYNPNGDFEVATPPDLDGISSLCFSPTANYLVATSWNNQAYCWEVSSTAQTTPKAHLKDHTQPVLCSAWMQDGTKVFTGGCDKSVRLWDLATGQSTQVAQHDAPVRHVFHVPQMNVIVTGGWDKTLRYWDMRSPTAALVVPLPERVYAMDVTHPMTVVGTAERNLHVFDMTQPQKVLKSMQSQLKWQTRTVTCFPDRAGYLVGSIEGRVAVQHLDDQLASTKNFTFKCHRDGNDIYAVNSIVFHPVFGTFATAGSDGTYNFWDKDSKQRLKAQAKSMYTPTQSAPIPCGCFNKDGSIYAYAVSYEWSKGYAEYNPSVMKNVILMHSTKEDEVKSKPKGPLTTSSSSRK